MQQIIQLFFGTAFLIAPNTYMTADHVLNAPWTIYHATYVQHEILELNHESDITIFKKESKGEPLNTECRDMEVGETLTIKGYPFINGQYTYTELSGEVIGTDFIAPSWQSNTTYKAVVVDIPIIGGFSGSPVFDSEGDVVGVAVASMFQGTPEHIGIVTSVCDIKS